MFKAFDFGSGSNHTFCFTGKRTTEFTGILLSLHFYLFFISRWSKIIWPHRIFQASGNESIADALSLACKSSYVATALATW